MSQWFPWLKGSTPPQQQPIPTPEDLAARHAAYVQREQEISAYVDQQLEWISNVVRQHLGPILDYDEAQQRTIVTLSGGALVAGVTLFQSVVDKNARVSAEWLLGLSWGLFALSIVALLVGGGASFGRMRGYTWALYSNRAAIQDELVQIQDLDARHQRAHELVLEAVRKTDSMLQSANQNHMYRWIIANLAFVSAIICFLIFGLCNL